MINTIKDMRLTMIAAEREAFKQHKISKFKYKQNVKEWLRMDNMKLEKWYKLFFR